MLSIDKVFKNESNGGTHSTWPETYFLEDIFKIALKMCVVFLSIFCTFGCRIELNYTNSINIDYFNFYLFPAGTTSV